MSKKNLILFLILLALIALFFVYQSWWLPKVAQHGRLDNFLAQVDFNQVDKMAVKRQGVETVLIKEGDKWRVQGAGEWYVNNLLIDVINETWQEAATGTIAVVSTSQEAKKDFKTDGDLTLTLFKQDQQLGAWALGMSQGGVGYVSVLESPETYEVKANLRSAFDYEEWRDFAIFKTDPDKLTKIKLTQTGQTIVLTKTKAGWQVAGNDKLKLNQDKVANLIMALSSLSAKTIPDQKIADTGLSKNIWMVEATGEGIKNILIIGQEEIVNKQPSGNLFVKTSASSNIYLVDKSTVGIFQVSLKDLKK